MISNRQPGLCVVKSHWMLVLTATVFVMLMFGCSTVRMTVSPRSILEEKLLVQGLDRALSQIDLKPLQDKWVAGMQAKGLPGKELLAEARKLVQEAGK